MPLGAGGLCQCGADHDQKHGEQQDAVADEALVLVGVLARGLCAPLWPAWPL